MLNEMIQRCEKLPWTILKNGKRSKNRFICCHTKERNHSREESGGSTDVGGASHRETDVLVESRVSKDHHSQSLNSGAHTGWVFCGQVVQEEHFLQEISCGCTREGFPIWVHQKPEIDVPGTPSTGPGRMTCTSWVKFTESSYEAIGKSDGRLNPERDGSRGFGEIGFLWHKSIGAGHSSSTR